MVKTRLGFLENAPNSGEFGADRGEFAVPGGIFPARAEVGGSRRKWAEVPPPRLFFRGGSRAFVQAHAMLAGPLRRIALGANADDFAVPGDGFPPPLFPGVFV